MRADLLETKARRVSTLLKAMGNERRLMILCHLVEGEKSVGVLEGLVGLSQSALSQHLARLRRDRFVRTRRQAQTIFYSIDSPEVLTVMRTLYTLYCAPEAAAANDHQGGHVAEHAAAADAAKD
jgi:DNA-binding transcriptional ArsR family regulator